MPRRAEAGRLEGGSEGGQAKQEGGLQGEPLPPCVVARLGRLSDWRGEFGLEFPPELGAQTLLKCKQMFLLVLSGDIEESPKEIWGAM
jgi:hypothetical protein